MSRRQYDVVVIGGGINGTMIAWDAAMRGLKTALIERVDFGYGTSSRSTRLIHGGLRYLEYFEFRLVRESLVERERLLNNAPHLVSPLSFLMPLYKGDRHNRFKMQVGMILYDVLSRGKSLPRHRMLSKSRVLELEPGLAADGLQAGASYHDAQCAFPERLCIEHAMSAAAFGADVINYADVLQVDLSKSSKTVQVQDRLTGATHTLQTKAIVNATGPWVDQVNERIVPGYNGSALRPRLRLTKGIHIVVPSISTHAILTVAARDGRVFFVIPWQGKSLVGTTDTDFTEDLDQLGATEDEVTYLIEETRRIFPQAPMDSVEFTTAGVRPLVMKAGRFQASDVSRSHAVVDHKEEGFSGLYSVLGGKITNHRLVAEETVDAVSRGMGLKVSCGTREHPTYGGQIRSLPRLVDEVAAKASEYGMDRSQAEAFVHTYGSKTWDMMAYCDIDPSLARRIVAHRPEIWAQVAYGVDHEMVRTTADFLLRRLGARSMTASPEPVYEEIAAFIGQKRYRNGEGIGLDLEDLWRQWELMKSS